MMDELEKDIWKSLGRNLLRLLFILFVAALEVVWLLHAPIYGVGGYFGPPGH